MAVSTAFPPDALARGVAIKTTAQNLKPAGTSQLPQRVAIVGQGASASTYPLTKQVVTSAAQAGTIFGFGSPVHLATLQVLPINGDGVGTIPVTIYPLEDDGAGIPASGTIVPLPNETIGSSYVVRINNIDSAAFTVSVGDTVADITAAITTAIQAELDMPVVATDNSVNVLLDAKWAGTSGNQLFVEVVGAGDTTFAITQPTGGATNPDVDDALNQFGEVWETLVVNCLELGDTASLDKYQTFGDGRWGSLVRKPCVVFSGNPADTAADAILIPDARRSDRINSAIPNPGSNDLQLVVAARAVARVAALANVTPPHDYGRQPLTGLTPGADTDQWNYLDRDLAVKGGSSTVQVKDGVVNMSDTVTFYHPTGDDAPAYRYVVDIIKVMNIIYNTDLIFEQPEWDGAPLIPDEDVTTEPTAKQPKSAVSALKEMLDNLGLQAIISDPATAKETVVAEIDSGNPKRLNAAYTAQLSGNTNVISIDLNFGFFFG